MNSMQLKNTFVRWLAAASLVAVLAGCSSGGAPTVENPPVPGLPISDYTGPASANADVQAFRINLWENIKGNNRCGSCHGAGGQTPMFARNDDVNLAYQAANSIVNLSQPDQSRMVEKVAGGHNCWLQSPAACGDTLTVWIRNWAGSTATGGTTIQLVAPPIKEVGGSKSFPASSAAFGASSLYALVRNPATANNAAMLFRGKADASLVNGVITSPMACLRLNGTNILTADAANQKLGPPVFQSVVMQCGAGPFVGSGGVTAQQVQDVFAAGSNNSAAFTATLASTFINGANETAAVATNPTTIDAAFTATTYVGAVQNTADTWYQGWTCDSSTATFNATASACTSLPAL